ncbi:hypothetical protein Dimus_015259 [Dionaea muscipula]
MVRKSVSPIQKDRSVREPEGLTKISSESPNLGMDRHWIGDLMDAVDGASVRDEGCDAAPWLIAEVPVDGSKSYLAADREGIASGEDDESNWLVGNRDIRKGI